MAFERAPISAFVLSALGQSLSAFKRLRGNESAFHD